MVVLWFYTSYTRLQLTVIPKSYHFVRVIMSKKALGHSGRRFIHNVKANASSNH